MSFVGLGSKLLPVMVTVVPTGPLEGLNPEITGWAKAPMGMEQTRTKITLKKIRLQFAELWGLMVKSIRLCVRSPGYNLSSGLVGY